MTHRDRTEPRRRSSGEVRALVLTAAQRLFAERGFDGAGTRDIAVAAGVTQAAIFRHFGTKEGLFEIAVAEPLQACITEFFDDWSGHRLGAGSNADIVRSFMILFRGAVQRNRSLFLAYFLTPAVAARGAADTDSGAPESGLSRQLSLIADRVQEEAERRGFGKADIPVAVRCAAGIALSVSLHGPLLFPGGSAYPDEDRILDEMVAFALAGIERR